MQKLLEMGPYDRRVQWLYIQYQMCSVQQDDSSPVFVAVVYRPPHVGLYAYKLDEHLRTCGGEFSHKIIMGDLNADLLKPNDAETRALLNLVENHSLKIVKHGAHSSHPYDHQQL